MHDIVIRGGTLIDGSGGEPRQGDLAISGGRISAVGEVAERGKEEIDAQGQAVTPGFIDVHTHYDAQYIWDPYATSSIWHGVTTTVIGNCGFAIAPCRPEHRDTAIRTLVKVEGMSQKAMETGIEWGFETFPEYLDFLQSCRPALNVAALLGHSAVRLWVMGADSQHREASAAEIAQMADITREAMAAGAIGLGSSTALAHIGDGGLPVPSRLAGKEEFEVLVRAMGEGGRGLFEITVGEGITSQDDLKALHLASGRPVVWAAFFNREDRPQWTDERLAKTEAMAAEGLEVTPQVACRPLTMDFTLGNPYPFEGMAVWQRILTRPEGEWPQVYADPDFRNQLRKELANRQFAVFRGNWDQVRVLKTGNGANGEEGKSIAQLARASGKDEVDTFLDLSLNHDMKTEYSAGIMNTDEAAVQKLISHPNTLVSLSDAGAHLSLLCDAGYSTHLLGYWVREKGAMTLQDAVHRLTAMPAQRYRIPGRGLLKEGYWADVVVLDPKQVAAGPPEWARDLPGGEARFISRGAGISWSLVNGVPVLKDNEVIERPARDRGGQVLREFDA